MAANLKDLRNKMADITKRYVHNISTRTEYDKMDQNLSMLTKTMGPGMALFAVSVAVELVTKHNMTQGMSPADAAELLRQFDASLPRATDLISNFKEVITFNNDLPMHTNIRAMGWFSTLAGGVAATVKLLADAAAERWGEAHADRIAEIGEEIARKGIGHNNSRKTGAVRLTEQELRAYMKEIDTRIEQENSANKPRRNHFADQVRRISSKETRVPNAKRGASRVIVNGDPISPIR